MTVHETIKKGMISIMIKIKKLAAVLAGAVMLGSAASALAFTDMPDGEMGVAIQNAVNNGLLTGYEDDTVKPYDPITRAQMSAIIVRAFGVEEKTSTSFKDVAVDAWYKDAVEKAVYMGAFQGDDNGNFNPTNNITFQETYTVLARVFQFTPRTTKNGIDVMKPDENCLNAFPDKDEIAAWAAEYARAVVGNGGYTGIDGKLKPTSSISRGEFAMVMDQLVSLYIDKPGTYTDGFGNSTVIVRTGGVTIDGLKTDRNLILSYGINSKTEVKNSDVKKCIVVYGGTDKTPVKNANGVTEADESLVNIESYIYECRIFAPYSCTGIKWLNEDPSNTYIKSYPDTAKVDLGFMQ